MFFFLWKLNCWVRCSVLYDFFFCFIKFSIFVLRLFSLEVCWDVMFIGFLLEVGIVWGFWLIRFWKKCVEGGGGSLEVFCLEVLIDEFWLKIGFVDCCILVVIVGVDLYVEGLWWNWFIWSFICFLKFVLFDWLEKNVVFFFLKVL